MRPRKIVVLVSDCEVAASRWTFVVETRLHCAVRAATPEELGDTVRAAIEEGRFGCVLAVTTRPPEALDWRVATLLARAPGVLVAAGWRAIPPDMGVRALCGVAAEPGHVLEAVRTRCAGHPQLRHWQRPPAGAAA